MCWVAAWTRRKLAGDFLEKVRGECVLLLEERDNLREITRERDRVVRRRRGRGVSIERKEKKISEDEKDTEMRGPLGEN